MKKLFLAAIAVSLFAGAASAQETKTKEKHKNGRAHGMAGKHEKNLEELNLSTSQKDQITAINANFRTGMENLRSQNLSREEKQTRMKALQQQHVEGIRSVLNAEQKTKFDEMHQQRANRGEGKFKYKEKSKTKK